jgi:ABC-type sugar transport system ATPase subunit
MDDIREIADWMTIYRDGRTVYTGAKGSLTDDEVVEQIMGTAVETGGRSSAGPRKDDSSEVPVLSVRGLSMRPRVIDMSFDVFPGEIVTLTGLVGAGRTEVVETVIGLRRADAGTVAVDGIVVSRRGPRQMARLGVALVPEDRDTQGLVYGFSIAENIAMGSIQEVSRRGVLRRREERRIAREQFDALSVRASGIHADVSSLSGGNRQKIVLGKWLATRPRLLILDEPTKGVDVGAKAEIHSILRRLASEQRVAIIVVSSDLDEVLEVSDRILVMRSGRLVAEFSGAEATEVGVMTASAMSDLQAAD